jgi:hypothetical protein
VDGGLIFETRGLFKKMVIAATMWVTRGRRISNQRPTIDHEPLRNQDHNILINGLNSTCRRGKPRQINGSNCPQISPSPWLMSGWRSGASTAVRIAGDPRTGIPSINSSPNNHKTRHHHDEAINDRLTGQHAELGSNYGVLRLRQALLSSANNSGDPDVTPWIWGIKFLS